MLRTLGVIFLSLCLVAMPSYAAVACGSACATSAATHEHACCPAEAAVAQAATADAADAPDEGAPIDSSHSGNGRHHCAAPCCGYVATILSGAATPVDSQPLADLLPPAAVLVGSTDHDAIFHPPRA